MYTKKIYFSGGSFHELQEVFSRVQGVVSATAGYINSEVESPQYEDVIRGKTGAAMGVEVSFNPKKIDVSMLMDILFTVINPYSKDRQGSCEGPMYRSGVYYDSAEDHRLSHELHPQSQKGARRHQRGADGQRPEPRSERAAAVLRGGHAVEKLPSGGRRTSGLPETPS